MNAYHQGRLEEEFGKKTSDYCVLGLRTYDQAFKAEVPMDDILNRLVECQSLGKRYNTKAFYCDSRERYIEFIGCLCGELQHHPETI